MSKWKEGGAFGVPCTACNAGTLVVFWPGHRKLCSNWDCIPYGPGVRLVNADGSPLKKEDCIDPQATGVR